MLKKVFFIIFLFLFAALLYGVYLYFKHLHEPVSKTLTGVPLNAVAIFESRNFFTAWQKLSRSVKRTDSGNPEQHPLWKCLSATEYFNDLNKNAASLDSIIRIDQSLNGILQYQPALISLHRSGAKEYNFLFLVSLPPFFNEVTIINAINRLAGEGATSTGRDYDNATITEITIAPRPPKVGEASGTAGAIVYSICKDIFICSFSPLLVEDAIRQINSETSLLNSAEFTSLIQTADKKADINVFLNFKTLPDFLSGFLKPEFTGQAQKLKFFADWCEGDITIKENDVTWNGFTFSNDTSANLVNVFTNRQAAESQVSRILPANTTFYFNFGLNDLQHLMLSYKNYLELCGDVRNYQNIIKSMSETRDEFIPNYLNWMGEEVCYFMTHPDSANILYNSCIAIKITSTEDALEKLERLNRSVPLFNDSSGKPENYKDHEIRTFYQSGFLQILPGNPFPVPDSCWYSILDEYLLFTYHPLTLKKVIDQAISGHTLKNDPNYSFFSDKQSDNPSIGIFLNINRMDRVLNYYCEQETFRNITPFFDAMAKGRQAMTSVQFFSGQDLLFTNLYSSVFENRELHEEENTVKWVFKPDTVLERCPHVVMNASSKTKEIFLQDMSKTIYLLDNSGSLLWKRAMDETIMGDVLQIDALRNGKFQFLFNTENRIFLVDRKGNDVDGFPLALPAKATSALSAFDYDRNRQYRLLVACNDNRIYNYDQKGKIVDGWKFGSSKETVHQPIRYFSLKGKDYVIAIDGGGNIYVLDRKGESRIDLTAHLGISRQNTYYVDAAGDLSKSRIVASDSAGVVHFVYFNNRQDSILFETFSSDHFFVYANMDNDKEKEYIFLDKDLLQAYKQNKKQLFIYTFNRFVTYMPQVVELLDQSRRIGVTIDKTDELFLFDAGGVLCPGFPVYGNTPFAVADMRNNGILHLVTGSSEGVMDYEMVQTTRSTVKRSKRVKR